MTAKSKSTPSILGELDQYLFREGRHWQLYQLLGAHLTQQNGIHGVQFAVWAPAARGVNLVGSFNGWQGDKHPMQCDKPTGIWHLFVPGVTAGEVYKYEVIDCFGNRTLKSDPVGMFAELPPQNASIVADLGGYRWHDRKWMADRAKNSPADQPWSIYEVHLGSWRHDPSRPNNWKNYRDTARELVAYCQEMGYTHLQLMPVSEHPYTGSWGYQTVGYYSVTSRYGSPHDFMFFVDHCHQHGIGVIVDWVPAHFPRDAHGLRRFDGTALYEHLDPRRGEHPDWGTMIFNYGRPEVRNFLIASALFWLDKYHVDGLRVDAVASMLYLDYSRKEGEWVPNQHGGRENLEAVSFLQEFNQQVRELYPGAVTIAEESTAWPGVSHSVDKGGLGFDMKWNMGWMNDTLRYMRRDPIHRKFNHSELTFSIWYAFSERFVLPLSHDEVVHGKRSLWGQMPGDVWRKFANLRLLFAYLWTHPGKKLTFMGSELGQLHEWNCDHEVSWELLDDAAHRGIQQLVAKLNRAYVDEPALHECDFDSRGFEWIDFKDEARSCIAYLRRSADQKKHVVVVANFTPNVYQQLRIGLPTNGPYQILIDTDDVQFGGSGAATQQKIVVEKIPWHRQEYSALLSIPPLGCLLLKPHPPKKPPRKKKGTQKQSPRSKKSG